jgi:hypothetical protein
VDRHNVAVVVVVVVVDDGAAVVVVVVEVEVEVEVEFVVDAAVGDGVDEDDVGRHLKKTSSRYFLEK